MANITNRLIKIELINRLCDQHATMAQTRAALEAIDRLEDCDLADQLMTAQELMEKLDEVLKRIDLNI